MDNRDTNAADQEATAENAASQRWLAPGDRRLLGRRPGGDSRSFLTFF